MSRLAQQSQAQQEAFHSGHHTQHNQGTAVGQTNIGEMFRAGRGDPAFKHVKVFFDGFQPALPSSRAFKGREPFCLQAGLHA